MSASVIEYRSGRTAAVYLGLSVFCSVFGTVYEAFSHGVYSFFMAFCFLPTLLLGALPFGVIYFAKLKMPDRTSFNLYNSGVASLAVGFVFRGVLEIYGTTNLLGEVYFFSSIFFIAASFITFMSRRRRKMRDMQFESID